MKLSSDKYYTGMGSIYDTGIKEYVFNTKILFFYLFVFDGDCEKCLLF